MTFPRSGVATGGTGGDMIPPLSVIKGPGGASRGGATMPMGGPHVKIIQKLRIKWKVPTGTITKPYSCLYSRCVRKERKISCNIFFVYLSFVNYLTILLPEIYL